MSRNNGSIRCLHGSLELFLCWMVAIEWKNFEFSLPKVTHLIFPLYCQYILLLQQFGKVIFDVLPEIKFRACKRSGIFNCIKHGNKSIGVRNVLFQIRQGFGPSFKAFPQHFHFCIYPPSSICKVNALCPNRFHQRHKLIMLHPPIGYARVFE